MTRARTGSRSRTRQPKPKKNAPKRAAASGTVPAKKKNGGGKEVTAQFKAGRDLEA